MQQLSLRLSSALAFFLILAGVQAQTIKDIDGNVYKTVSIGNQVWMAENLKTTKYNDGTAITIVTDSITWEVLTKPAYCWYKNNEQANKNIYGALYNWYVVNTNKLCPSGWHVPTDKEWIILTAYLGGEAMAGAKLKEAGTAHWKAPNYEATNQSRFTALPGGYRSIYGECLSIGEDGWWWSSTEEHVNYTWAYHMYYGYSNLDRFSFKKVPGFSVRCVKD